MKKAFKRIAMMLCTLMITVGFMGGSITEADAATQVTCKYTVNASMGPAAGTVASSSRSYTVHLQSSTGSKIKLGTATKSGSKYVLSGSAKFTMNKGATEKLRIVVSGKDHQGKTRTWYSNYSSVTGSTKSKTFTIRGYVDQPTFSIK